MIFEAILQSIDDNDDKETINISFLNKILDHVPVSVSVFSNVPGYDNKPIFICDNDPDQLINNLLKQLMKWNFIKGKTNHWKKIQHDTALFKIGTESRWNDEVHVVQSASGNTVVLTDGTTHREDKVLMVPHNTVIAPTTEKNVIKVAAKKHRDKSYFKREGIVVTNVIEGKRQR